MTRHEAEADILEIAGAAMPLSGISTATDVSGNVPTLNSALRAGLKAVGITPAGRTVTDTDIAQVDADDEDHFIKAAQVAILDLVLLRWTRITVSDNGSSQQWGQLFSNLKVLADQLRSEMRATYGSVTNTVSVGVMSLNVIDRCDDESEWS